MDVRLALNYFDARGAVETGAKLADRVATGLTGQAELALDSLLHGATSDMSVSALNFYKRARLANRFRWRLLEHGLGGELADAATERLVLELAGRPGTAHGRSGPLRPAPARQPTKTKPPNRAQGDLEFKRGSYERSIRTYQDAIARDPGDLAALHNLAAAFIHVGRHHEARALLRTVIAAAPGHFDASLNLGTLLRWMGDFAESEGELRRAVALRPAAAAARIGLASTLVVRGRLAEARAELEAGLRLEPRDAEGLATLGQVEHFEGAFEAAGVAFERALELEPRCLAALVGATGVRRMTPADAGLLQSAERACLGPLAPLQEASLRFAMGKHCDDVHDFATAFGHYRRTNELLKTAADPYDRAARVREVDATLLRFSRARLRPAPAATAAAEKTADAVAERAVFVVGMMRSGTSLAEQILASHPAVHGAGELGFWSAAAMELHGSRSHPPEPAERHRLAQGYARLLRDRSADAARVVDKAPVNGDHLGLIHAVLPGARVIHLVRDPLDTCLSCYFQQFSAAQNFTMDLADLAHYYREHARLMAHWHAALPAGTLLEVPYACLVGDTETWARRMIAFLGLEWDPRCVDFHLNRRPVVTASSWQVRQRVYADSIGRWRNYRKFLGPLLELRDLI